MQEFEGLIEESENGNHTAQLLCYGMGIFYLLLCAKGVKLLLIFLWIF